MRVKWAWVKFGSGQVHLGQDWDGSNLAEVKLSRIRVNDNTINIIDNVYAIYVCIGLLFGTGAYGIT